MRLQRRRMWHDVLVWLALVLLPLAAQAQAPVKPGMSVGSPGAASREPYGPTPVLHPDLPASNRIQYWRPAERLDLALQAAQGIEGLSQTALAGQKLSPDKVGELSVIEFGPRGTLLAENARPQIYLTFSQPMVPVAKLGAPLLGAPGISIEPPLKGVYRWNSTKSLVIEPEESLAPLAEYRVTVGKEAVSLYGTSLKTPFSFGFHAGEFQLLALRSEAAPEKDAYELSPAESAAILLYFNREANIAGLRKSLDVRVRGGASLAFELEAWNAGSGRPSPTTSIARLRFLAPLPENSDIEIVLKAGARAYPGAAPTEVPYALQFHTLFPFTLGELPRETQRGLYRYRADDANPIWLEFSHPVDPAGLAGFLSVRNLSAPPSLSRAELQSEKKSRRGAAAVDPSRTELRIADDNIGIFGRRVRINGLKFDLDAEYLVTISPGIKDVYGRSLAKGGSFRFRLGNPLSYAYFPHEGWAMMEAQFPAKTLAEVQELEYLKVGVRKVNRIEEAAAKAQLAPVNLRGLPPQTKHYEVLDLAPSLNREGKGWVRVDWEARDKSRDRRSYKSSLFLQVTDLGVTTRIAYNRVVCLVTSLATGRPVQGATVKLLARYAEKLSARTDEAGVAVFELPPGYYRDNFYVSAPGESWKMDRLALEVSKGEDRIYWEPSGHDAWRYDVAGRADPEDVEAAQEVAFLFSDRMIYRPGETLKFRGIDRNLALGTYSPAAKLAYEIKLEREEDEESVLSNAGTTTEAGSFWGELRLPEDLEPGSYRLVYRRGGSRRETVDWVVVSNFRRLQFQAAFESSILPAFASDDVAMTLAASYLAGGAMQNASYEGYWTKEPYAFRPTDPRYAAFRFNQGDEWGERVTLSSFSGMLDGEGRATVRQKAAPEGVQGKIYRYVAHADITDNLSGQSVSATRGVIVYPAEFIIGAAARTASGTARGTSYASYFRKGEAVGIDYVALLPSGAAYSPATPRPVSLSVVREEWKLVQQQGEDGIDSRWTHSEVPVLEREEKLAASASSFTFTPDKEGQYLIRIAAQDRLGRETVVAFRIWATGNEWVNWYGSNPNGIDLSPEKPVYAVGETARLLMRSPLPAGDYLVTVEREGIMSSRLVHYDGPTQLIELPIEERHVPVVYVAISSYSVRKGPPAHRYGEPDLDKPKGYFGLAQVRVDTSTRRIKLDIAADKPSYLPGAKATFTVTATLGGKPVPGAEICFMAVDRGVVDIVNYHVQDPMSYFYAAYRFPLGTRGGDSRAWLLDPVTYQVKDQFGGDEEDTKLSERKDFRPTAIFEPALKTGPDGKARISFTWPDNLTTYRCTALAVTAERFGLAEVDSQVRNPINVKTALPRKMRIRDTAYAGVIVTNMDAAPQRVTVRCESDLLEVDDPKERSVTIQPGASAELAFALCATRAGTGEITFTTRSAAHSEVLKERYVVEEPLVMETVASLGSVEAAADVPASFLEGLVLPADSPGGKGGLEITLGASKLPTLSGAVRYVFDYPYGCNEQLSARILPLVLFGEYIDAFGLSSRVADPRAAAEAALAQIAATQRSDGSFGIWAWSAAADYYVTVRVAHIVDLMRKKGWTLPAKLKVEPLFRYVREKRSEDLPFEFSFALRVLAEAGELRKDEAEAVLRSTRNFKAAEWSQLGLVFLALKDEARADFCLQKALGFLKQSPRSVDIDASGLGRWNDRLSSMSMLLELLVRRNPSSDIARRLVASMLAEQRAGYWQSTNTTYWVLSAFAAAVKAEGGTPDFKASVLLAGKELTSAEFRSLSGLRQVREWPFAETPLSSFPRDRLLPLEFRKEGRGTLYYGAVLRYAVPLETAVNRDEGFEVVSRITLADGSPLPAGALKRGQLYRLTVSVTSDKLREFVAVRMPVPSGADIVESVAPAWRLGGAADAGFGAGAEPTPRRGGDEYGYDDEACCDDGYYAASTVKVFDNEAHAYVTRFAPGTQSFSVLFRATSAGVFPVPPATAECMYEPEVFGRDVSTLVLIAR